VEFRERRRYRRFPLQQPATISYNDGEPHQLAALSRNVSLGGGFFTAPQAVPNQASVQVRLAMDKDGLGKVSLRGAGKIVRCETFADGEVRLAIEFAEKLTEA